MARLPLTYCLRGHLPQLNSRKLTGSAWPICSTEQAKFTIFFERVSLPHPAFTLNSLGLQAQRVLVVMAKLYETHGQESPHLAWLRP